MRSDSCRLLLHVTPATNDTSYWQNVWRSQIHSLRNVTYWTWLTWSKSFSLGATTLFSECFGLLNYINYNYIII
jgi:hypothetical protein